MGPVPSPSSGRRGPGAPGWHVQPRSLQLPGSRSSRLRTDAPAGPPAPRRFPRRGKVPRVPEPRQGRWESSWERVAGGRGGWSPSSKEACRTRCGAARGVPPHHRRKKLNSQRPVPGALWKDGACRTVVLAGVGRERGSSAGAGEGLLSVIFTPQSQCSGFCFAAREKWQPAVRALIHRFLRHPSLYAVTVKTLRGE